MQTYICTQIYWIYIHGTQTYTYRLKYKHMYIHNYTYMHAPMHRHAYIHWHAQIYWYMYTDMHITLAYTHMQKYTDLHAHIQMYTQISRHTLIHMPPLHFAMGIFSKHAPHSCLKNLTLALITAVPFPESHIAGPLFHSNLSPHVRLVLMTLVKMAQFRNGSMVKCTVKPCSGMSETEFQPQHCKWKNKEILKIKVTFGGGEIIQRLSLALHAV